MRINFNSIADENLPSNRKFGLFFALIFFLLFIFFYNFSDQVFAMVFGVLSLVITIVSFYFEDLLRPFNKLWMAIGLIISKVVSPLIMGIIYFLIFTPISFWFKLTGRDYLNLKYHSDASYWVKRSEKKILPSSFEKQF
jgi:hypothetical protein